MRCRTKVDSKCSCLNDFFDIINDMNAERDFLPVREGCGRAEKGRDRAGPLAGKTRSRPCIFFDFFRNRSPFVRFDGSKPLARPQQNIGGRRSLMGKSLKGKMEKIMNMSSSVKPEMLTAAVVEGPGRVAVVERPLREPAAGEVRVRLEGCGVCASNLTPWSGPDWMKFPTEAGGLGHEGWGVIDALGEGVAGLKVGMRVALLSYNAYASHDFAPAEMVVPLPPSLDGQPFPGEPLGCAMNIFARADIRAGQTVAIIGIGFLGALLTQLASAAGARVIAISRRQQSLDVARRMGAAEVIAMDDHWRIIEAVKTLTDGRFCDRVIEAVGYQWPLDLAAELTMERGRLIIAGYHQDGPRQVNMQMWNWRGLDVVNAHERDPAIYVAGMRAALAAMAEGRLDPAALYTHRYRLDQLDQALNATRDRPDNFVKALVVYA